MRTTTAPLVHVLRPALLLVLCAILRPAAVALEPPEILVLAEGGSTAYPVVVAPAATAPERHAAEELARFLAEITGAPFVVRTDETPPEAGSRAILVGPTAAAGVFSRDEIGELGREGYRIRTRGATLAIAGGRPRGTLYGVYSFLEDVLGCRWFTPEVSRIPKAERVAIRPLDRKFVPPLEARSTDYPSSRDKDWAARNKINGTQTNLDDRRGGKISYGPFVHTFDAILDPAQHFEAHPEWFSEVDGKRLKERTQLCLTNAEVLRIAIDTVRGWMRSMPEATIFSVSQNDWYNFCTCKECSRIMEEEGSPMGPYLRFVNAVADAVREEFPLRAIDTLAYQFTRKPPRISVPRPNVIVRLSSIECCFAHPLVARAELDRANAAFAGDLRAWGRISDRLYIWDYVIDYAHSIMPFPNLYSLKPNINFFIENGVKGIYEEANYFSKGGELAELRTWILARTLWDPSHDTDRAIDEFLDGYYEEAATPIRRYIDLIHGKARMDGVHFRIFDGPSSPLFSDDVVSRAAALLAEARSAVESKPAVLHRAAVASLPIDYVRIFRLLPRVADGAEVRGEDVALLRDIFRSFDATARREGISMVSEGRTYAAWAEATATAVREAALRLPRPTGVAAQLYVWTQEYGRKGQRMEDHLDDVFAATKRAGYDEVQGWLSFYASPEAEERTSALLEKHGLSMRSAYTGGRMHADEGAGGAAEATAAILEQAERGARRGLRVVVMNPDVVGREKTDEELAVQARNLDRLGGALRELGLFLAIHTHDPEMRSEAREWTHILRNTDPGKVFFCLDLHWVLRGKQDPYRLLEDAGKRVVDLHLRNSTGGVWSEDLGDGEIDHAKVREILDRIGFEGLLTVELAHEGATRITRSLEENLTRSRTYIRTVFGR